MNFLNSEGLSRVQTHIQTALDMKADKLQVEKQFTDSVADWNQNDEFAVDYVKNKPFYAISLGDTVRFDGTINVEEGWYESEDPSFVFDVVPGAIYEVTYNGTVYTVIGKDGYLGSYTLYMGPEYKDTEEPFCYYSYDGIGGFAVSEPGSYDVKIIEKAEIVNRLDAKFGAIKQGTGMLSEVFNGGSSSAASGMMSHAEGESTASSGYASHAEGCMTTASGSESHAEGSYTTASGMASHAEGNDTVASGGASHAEGVCTIASGDASHVEGRYNIEDTKSLYAHITGNGYYQNNSNAHTLDWSGNAWYSGDVYVGSTSGTNKDEGSKKLATEEYVNTNGTKVIFRVWENLITFTIIDTYGTGLESPWIGDIQIPEGYTWSQFVGSPYNPGYCIYGDMITTAPGGGYGLWDQIVQRWVQKDDLIVSGRTYKITA